MRSLITITLAAVVALAARGQSGFALGDPSYAMARDAFPPRAWRLAPLDEDFTLVIPWFGTSPELPADRWRTLMTVTASAPSPGGGGLLIARFRPSDGAVQLVTPVLANTPVSAFGLSADFDEAHIATIPGIATDDQTHYCLVASYDASAETLDVYALKQGVPGIAGQARIEGRTPFPPLKLDGRIFAGSPGAAPASHTGPVFPFFMRRGTSDAAEIADDWDRPGGPRYRDFIDADVFDQVFIFFFGTTGDIGYITPFDEGRVYVWFDGDGQDWGRWLGSDPGEFLSANAPAAEFEAYSAAPLYEPSMPWSGFWQPAPPPASAQIGLRPVAGNVASLRGVLNGTRSAPAALMAWGLGNSRWSNTSVVPISMTDPTPVSRSHLLGLRDARPDYDGGLVVLNLGQAGVIRGLSADFASGAGEDNDSNWTRFSYGSSFAPNPGNGAPVHIEQGGAFGVLSEVRRPELVTESLAVLLMRPRGGTVRLEFQVGDAQGQAVPAAGTRLFGDGPSISTNTTRGMLTVDTIDSLSLTVTGNTAGVLPGDALVGDDHRVVNVVESVQGQTITVRWPWIFAPTPGQALAFGAYSFRMVGYASTGTDASVSGRGLRLSHLSGGTVTLVGAGYRETVPTRICYILAGRGGLGQQDQADREAPGTLDRLSAALGCDFFFVGNATQSEGTVPALDQQLGVRLQQCEFIATPDIINAQANTFGVQTSLGTHTESRDAAIGFGRWAYVQIQDQFPDLFDQALALGRQDSTHPSGRGMVAAGDLWWAEVEASIPTLLANPCPADVNNDGIVAPNDLTAWISAYNARRPEADQNGDGLIASNDFASWIQNYIAGCP